MYKFKKFMAVALAATMVMGSSITAFATDTTPATSGTSEGAGTSEGHVDKHTVSVTLPTIPDSSTPFAYTMDLERLIQGTTAAKYAEGTTFPVADVDTGVYFLTAEKTYGNESQELTVTSESSADVKLKVEVEAVSAETDVDLVSAAPLSTVADPQLYLALKVGSEDAVPVEAGKTISKEVTIAGVPGNFVTTWDNTSGAYKYSAKSDASGWGTTTFKIEGAASKAASAEGLTAPTLKVTWSWTDPAAGPAIASGASAIATPDSDGAAYSVNLVNGTASNIVFTLGDGMSISKVYANGNPSNLTTENESIVTFSGSTVTLKGDSSWATAVADTIKYIKVVVSTGESTSQDFIIKVVCNPS